MDEKSNAFDLMRLLAALTVLYSHSFPSFGLAEPMVFGDSLGKAAVGVFFAISGFLVCRSWEHDPDIRRFAQRRLLRIGPGLIVSVLCTALVIGSMASTSDLRSYLLDPSTWAYIRSNVTMVADIETLPHVFESAPYPIFNGSLWTLRYECLMYATLVAAASTRHLRIACGLLFIGCAAALVTAAAARMAHFNLPLPGLWKIGLQFDGIRLARLAVYFFGGSCLYLFRRQLPLTWPAAAAGAAALLLMEPGGPWTAGLLSGMLPYIVMVAVFRAPAALRLAAPADLSYGVYVYAYPVQQGVTQIAHAQGWPWLAALLLSIVATTMLAAASWAWVEKPALRLKPRRRATPAPVPVAALHASGSPSDGA